MNIYHHPARGNQPESYTLVFSKQDTSPDSPRNLAWRTVRLSYSWRFVSNFFSPDVMYYTTNSELAKSFALRHGLQIEEGTE